MSIHTSCGVNSCRGVGANDGGGSVGAGKRGPVCGQAYGLRFLGIPCGRARMDLFVKMARKTLYWTRGIRWSLERGSIILPFGESGLKEDDGNELMNKGSDLV